MDAGTPVVDAGDKDAGPPDAGPQDGGFCVDDEGCQTWFGDPNKVCDQVISNTEDMCVDRCFKDDDCEHYQLSLRCNESTGQCVKGELCNNASNCWQGDPDHYCNMLGGVGCRCVTEANSEGFLGVCRRRYSPCEECTDDTQCGSTGTFDPVGRCYPLANDKNALLPDGGTRRYCFYAEQGACPCGMGYTAQGVCAPTNGSCQAWGCFRDADCPSGSVCKVSSCNCEPRCLWNFDTQSLNPPGCSPGFTCWVDEENLDPDSPYFGAGRCKPPCDGDEDCQAVSPLLVCRKEPVAGSVSEGRCRPAGECMDDFECPEQPPDAIYLGYCDRATLTCVDDSCRIGTDPTTGLPYDDCRQGFTCAEENGVNICKEVKCADLGGARIACNLGQYCCGEDRNNDGTPEACPLTGLESNNCYKADSPPFCTTCSSDADCAQYPNPSGSTLPSLCRYIERPGPPQGDGVQTCMVATFNDFTPDQYNVTRAFRGCPAKYPIDQTEKECASNADCGANGFCDAKPGVTLPDGGPILRCLCIADGTPNKTFGCPEAAPGVPMYCRYGPPNTTTVCVGSVFCSPTASQVFGDPALGGCGL